MAFVEIYRGSVIKRVPESAYEAHYKNLGYKIKSENRIKSESSDPGRNKGEDIDSIPLSEMTQKQLKEFAQQHDIDISGANSAREARNIINKALRDR